MADSTTTGCTLYGCVPGGLVRGMSQGAAMNTPRNMTDKVLFVYGNPKNVVTASVGSQLAYDVENADVYCAIAQNGSNWNRLGSLT